MKSLLESKDVTVLIVNYRGADDTINCLYSLHNLVEAPGRIIVIDNNSNDGSVDKIFFAWCKYASPSIVKENDIETTRIKSRSIILMMPKNGGYAYGNNGGIRLAFKYSGCKAVWIINNDTISKYNTLKELCIQYNSHNNHIIGSSLVYLHDKKTIQCLGGGYYNIFFGTTRHIGENNNIHHIDTVKEKYLRKNIDYINGASLFIHKDIINIIGNFDERFFMYYEDVELCIRAKKYGIKCSWASKSIIYHKAGETIKQLISNIKIKKQIDYNILCNRMMLSKLHFKYLLPSIYISYIILPIKRLFFKQNINLFNIIKSIYANNTYDI